MYNGIVRKPQSRVAVRNVPRPSQQQQEDEDEDKDEEATVRNVFRFGAEILWALCRRMQTLLCAAARWSRVSRATNNSGFWY